MDALGPQNTTDVSSARKALLCSFSICAQYFTFTDKCFSFRATPIIQFALNQESNFQILFFSLKMANQNSLHEGLLSEEFAHSVTAFVVLPDMPVRLFALHNGHATRVVTAIVSEAGATTITEAVRIMHDQDSPRQQRKHLVVIRTISIADPVKAPVYPYTFRTNGKARAPFNNMSSSRLYAWDTRAMVPFPLLWGQARAIMKASQVLTMRSLRLSILWFRSILNGPLRSRFQSQWLLLKRGLAYCGLDCQPISSFAWCICHTQPFSRAFDSCSSVRLRTSHDDGIVQLCREPRQSDVKWGIWKVCWAPSPRRRLQIVQCQ